MNVSFSQVENVPLYNQVYEFLNRMNVKGILQQYSNTILPISRKEVGEMLKEIASTRDQLSIIDKSYLDKFEREFANELGIVEQHSVLFTGEQSLSEKMNKSFSDREKYLYEYQDSNATMYVEFLGSIENRMKKVTNTKSVSTQLLQYGGRIRGTYKNRLGYSMQTTNGTQYGNKPFALEDPKLKTNYKLNEPNSNNFDFTEGYLRADLDWLNIQFGSEFQSVGTGYSDKLILSDNAPVFDALKIDAKYKSVKFLYLHGITGRRVFTDVFYDDEQVEYSINRYFAFHRVQFSLTNFFNIGLSEMVIYQLSSPEFSYLNPFSFYKSGEHSRGDLDNSLIALDIEVFPLVNYKLYATFLIDDIDFQKIGTGWWGNEVAWQFGVLKTNLFNFESFDGIVEYTRIEPFVYSHHKSGNSYTYKEQNLGPHLQPNSDELFLQVNYRSSEKLRAWFLFASERHGENILNNFGQLIKNVGGNILEGHRRYDSDKTKFLAGNLRKTTRFQLKAIYEPITNYFVEAMYEFRNENLTWLSQKINSNYFSMQIRIEY